MTPFIRPVVAFGPRAPEFGSWEWVGADIARALSESFATVTFRDTVPVCDVAIFIKFKPAASILQQLSQRSRIVYVPVDLYGSGSEIDGDRDALRHCDVIVVHCEELQHYFSAHARTLYIDHHLKFVAPMPAAPRTDGPVLWIGNHSNLPPLVDWLHRHTLPEELWVLSDLDEQPPARLGFPGSCRVRIGRWSPERHVEWTSLARAAIDIKGDDFRSRHKPPAKALDFIASGLPLAMNPGTSSGEHLRRHYELILPDPSSTDLWFSREYWEQCQSVGQRLRARLRLPEVTAQWSQLLRNLTDDPRPLG